MAVDMLKCPFPFKGCHGKSEVRVLAQGPAGQSGKPGSEAAHSSVAKAFIWNTVAIQLFPLLIPADHSLSVWLWVICGGKYKARGFVPGSCGGAS